MVTITEMYTDQYRLHKDTKKFPILQYFSLLFKHWNFYVHLYIGPLDVGSGLQKWEQSSEFSTPMHRKKSDFERLDCNYISQSVSYDFFSEWICWTLFECIHNPQILVDYIHTARLLMLLYERNDIFILTHTNHTHTPYVTNFRRKESWFIT